MCINNANMEEVYKFEAETLRRVARQCADLLFKYGHKFDKDDRDKAISLVAMIKNGQDFDRQMYDLNESFNNLHQQALAADDRIKRGLENGN